MREASIATIHSQSRIFFNLWMDVMDLCGKKYFIQLWLLPILNIDGYYYIYHVHCIHLNTCHRILPVKRQDKMQQMLKGCRMGLKVLTPRSNGAEKSKLFVCPGPVVPGDTCRELGKQSRSSPHSFVETA